MWWHWDLNPGPLTLQIIWSPWICRIATNLLTDLLRITTKLLTDLWKIWMPIYRLPLDVRQCQLFWDCCRSGTCTYVRTRFFRSLGGLVNSTQNCKLEGWWFNTCISRDFVNYSWKECHHQCILECIGLTLCLCLKCILGMHFVTCLHVCDYCHWHHMHTVQFQKHNLEIGYLSNITLAITDFAFAVISLNIVISLCKLSRMYRISSYDKSYFI